MELTFEGVSLRRGAFTLDVDGRFRARTLGLSGKSGAGKTTFLELLAGLRRPLRGRVSLDGRRLDDAETGLHIPARERKLGYVPQDADLFPHLDVRRNLLFGAARAGTAGPPWDLVVAALGLDALVKRDGEGLSGGERRRVALGRALLSGPECLILDEPFGGLDQAARASLHAALRRLRDDFGIPWILVSHERSDLSGLCDLVLAARGGSVRISERRR